MKKYIIIAIAALAASAACSKVETVDLQKEINFEVAKHALKTKANVKYENGNFGTYSWFTAASGSDHASFMTNETVGLKDGVWKTTVNTFYWPKTGNIDFISYSPFNGTNATADSNPEVDQTTITYTAITVDDVDYMYADKVTVLTTEGSTKDDVNDGIDSGYKGVPTIFRHALAKVSFQIKANFLEWGTAPNKTTWKLTVQDLKIGGLYTKGDLHLTWNGTEWVPQDVNKIWENPSEKTLDQDLADDIVLTTDYQDLAALTNPYVLPQALAADTQKVTLKAKIETTLANGNKILENFEKTFDLADISDLDYLQMNKNIVYKIQIKPTANVSTPDSPEDVTITYDPAVEDWDTVTSDITIQL